MVLVAKGDGFTSTCIIKMSVVIYKATIYDCLTYVPMEVRAFEWTP